MTTDRPAAITADCSSSTPYYKILLVGNSGVGKSSIIHAFSEKNAFQPTFISTIGSDFKVKTIELNHGTPVKLQIWASAGEQRLHSTESAQEFYSGAKGIMIVYDVTNVRSFGYVPQWLQIIEEFGNKEVELMILGNKCEMEDERMVPKEFGENVAKEHGVRFLETSAVNKLNIEKAFQDLAHLIHTKINPNPGTNNDHKHYFKRHSSSAAAPAAPVQSSSSSSSSFHNCPCL